MKFFFDQISAINHATNSQLILIPDESTLDEEFESATLVFFSQKITDDLKRKVELEVTRLYESHKLVTCSKCNCVYNKLEKDMKCVSYYHEGKRIKFPDTNEDEFIEADDSGIAYAVHFYTCCGECAEHEPGCKYKNNGKHQEDLKTKPFSDFVPLHIVQFSELPK